MAQSNVAENVGADKTAVPITAQLVPVTANLIGEVTVPTVNARELHGFLKVGRDFSTWIKERIEEYEFAEGQDYVLFHRSPKRGSGNRGAAIDYHLSMDMAKELSMVERTPQGQAARRYFIECERRLFARAKPDAALAEPSLTPEEASRKTTVEDRKPYKAMVDAWVAAARTNGKFLTHQEAYRIARSSIGGRKAPEMFLGDVPVAIAFVKEKLEQELAAASPLTQGQPQAALPPAQPTPTPKHDSHARLARLTRNWANTHSMHPVDAMSLQRLVRKVCDATQVYEKVLQEVSQEAMRPFRERTGATPPFDFLMDPLAEMFRNGEDGVRPIYRLYYQALQGVIWVNEIIAICKDKDD